MKKMLKAAPGLRPVRLKPAPPSASARTVGVLGLGIIGSRVADACRRAGIAVVAWNRTRRRGQSALSSPMEVAHAARVLQIFVTDDAALASVVGALLPALTKQHVVLNCSTVSLAATRAAAAAVERTGAAFLDAPFTGSKNAAAAGELVYYIGGPAAVLQRVRWALEPSAKAIVPLGRVGDATVIKIATNLVSAIAVEALSEALGVVTAHGIGADAFLVAMEHNANSSGLSRMKLPGMVAGRFEPHFSLKNMWKDAGFAEQLAQSAGLEIPALTVARIRMGALVGKGRGEEDFSVLAANYAGRPRRKRSPVVALP
jgi:3-hydroxyisobutyrate dehydrogenase-like beta-hydroxyacid dehydrogenase